MPGAASRPPSPDLRNSFLDLRPAAALTAPIRLPVLVLLALLLAELRPAELLMCSSPAALRGVTDRSAGKGMGLGEHGVTHSFTLQTSLYNE